MAAEAESPSADLGATPAQSASPFISFLRLLKRAVFRVVSSLQGVIYGSIFAMERALTYTYVAIIASFNASVGALSKSKLLRSVFSNLKRLVVSIAFLAVVYVVIRETVFIVDYDFGGVILRLGQYNRTVAPGVNFKLPIIEKSFIVNTQDRRQEHFGFIQLTPPPGPATSFERDILEEEQDSFRDYEDQQLAGLGSGNLAKEAERKGPGLTRDYVIDSQIPAPKRLRQEEEEGEVEERITLRAEAANLVIPPSGKVPVPEEMKMLAGDLNIVYLTYSVQYEIVTAEDYLFNSIDVKTNIRDISQIAIRVAVGDRATEGVLSYERKVIEEETLNYIQDIVSRYRLGILVTNVIIQDANPPDQVKAAYHRVNSAKQEMEDTINLAESEYNGTLPQMVGKAERLKSEALAYQVNLTQRATGEAARFSQILVQYRTAPEVIRTRYYLEALEGLHERVAVTLVDPQLKGILPVFTRDHPATSAGASHAVSQSVSEFQELQLNPGQYQTRTASIPLEGPHAQPHRGVDPPGVMNQSNSAELAAGSPESFINRRPSVTIIDPLSTASPTVSQ